jgi:serine/threonine protein phosphatase 1
MPGGAMGRLWRKAKRLTVANARVPSGDRIYAVGDIHGRVDLLERLHAKIQGDADSAPPATRKTIIYLGDYVDRGFNSKELIDFLLDKPLRGIAPVYLKGNHDEYFANFIESYEDGEPWLKYGGDATVYSYGVRISEDVPPEQRLEHIRESLRETVPERHMAFFRQLRLAWTVGDFLFVHAGIHPDRPWDRQVSDDLLWIRDEFLQSNRDFGKIVVHGHSVTEEPDVRDNRIGIDTGACYSNVLTCLVLEEDNKRFLSTADG